MVYLETINYCILFIPKSICNVSGVVLQDQCFSVAGLVSVIHDIHKVLGCYVCMVHRNKGSCLILMVRKQKHNIRESVKKEAQQ